MYACELRTCRVKRGMEMLVNRAINQLFIFEPAEESVTGRDRVGVKGKRDSRQGVLERSARYGAAD